MNWTRDGVSALVTGVGGSAGRATASFLRERGIPIAVADARPIRGEPDLIRLPMATEPEYPEALATAVAAHEVALLVPTVTEELPVVARRRGVLCAARCTVFISPVPSVETTDDKWLTVRALERAGVAVPRSLSGCDRAEIESTIGYPLLSKPRRGRGGRGVLVHETPQELPVPREDRVYQEFAPGEEFDVNLFAEPGGQPAVMVVLRKTALREGRVGNAVGVERVDAPDVAELAAAASRALRLEGPIDMDIRRGRDGRPLVLEVNARVGANVRDADEVLEELLRRWRESR